MARWFWGLATPAGGTARTPKVQGSVFMELPRARGRRLSARVDPAASDDATFTLSGADPAGGFIGDLDTDLVVQRDSDVLFRGRVGSTGDSLDSARHDAVFSVVSYRELLKRRALTTLSTLSYSSVDQAAIVWALVDYTQGLPNGYLGVGRGAGATGMGFFRTVAYAKDNFVFDNIAALAQMDDGFDWNITPHAGNATDLRLDLWQGGLRVDRGLVLEWGSDVVRSATRTFDMGSYANLLYAMGDTSASLTPVSSAGADLATFAGGRFEAVTTTTDVVQATLAARAAWILGTLNQKLPTWQVKLAQGAWGGPSHVWAGDLVTWRVRSGRLNENRQYRVAQLDVEPGDSGGEQVTLSLGLPPRDIRRIIGDVIRDIGKAPHPVFHAR